MGEIRAREEEIEARVRPEAFIQRRRVPRHVVEEGEFDSEGGEEEHDVAVATSTRGG